MGVTDLAKFGDTKNDADSSMVSGKSNLSDVVERVQNSLLIPHIAAKKNNTFLMQSAQR